MAIIKGAINFGSNFNIGAKGPIDARQRVETIADLTTVWTAEIPAYKGMVVSVLEDNSIYILKSDDATVFDNWKRVGDATGDITNLQGQITANKTAIDKINGDANTTGSFAKGDADTLAAAKADATMKVDAAKTELLGETGVSGNTIISAKEDAAAASAKVDTEIGKLDVAGNISETVKGVTVTVDETDGKVIKPVVSIADGTLTGAATDGNLVTGTVVKKYVDDKVSDINTSANALGERVGTLETKVGSAAADKVAATGLFKEIADEASTARAAEKKNADAIAAEATRATAAEKKNADAIAAETTRATAAEEKVKTDLLGDAAAEYNTLGKLEDKIQAEASRADAAEKANAAAAAAAKAAADKAQETADEKVKSVEGTGAVVATTTEHAVSVSLKTSDKGNVKFTQDPDGLSANVTIPAATVTGVKADDKVLALDGTKLTSTISLSVDATAGTDGKKYIRLKGIDGADLGKIDTADFVKDGMLQNAEYSTDTHKITLTFNTNAGKEAIELDLNDLVNVYKAGNGLALATDGTFSINTDITATKESVDAVAGRVTTLEGKVGSAAADKVAATGLFKDVADNKAAIDTLNGDVNVPGSVDKKIKDALDKGAVTLEVKDTDAYLGVTSAKTENGGTVYTLASKEAKINEAIKTAADAVKVSVTNGTYVKGSVDEAGRAITLSETVQEVESSSANAMGLAEASDVKAYVDKKVGGKNVSAEGDAYVSASAADNKVTVAATGALTTAVNKANSAVQSVNGVSATAVTLDATNIGVGAGVGQQEATATVNAVLADIYTKLGTPVKADGKTIKAADDHTLSVNLETKTDQTVAAGHIALEHDEDGALYGVMYYLGDDAE
ncbi:MAG: hypothetical protein UHU19_15270 [Lachnospiraceae bacterium]|nr:hypothetical protein [Lachnospiraceae bacterium]